jgi:hypothetical protein
MADKISNPPPSQSPTTVSDTTSVSSDKAVDKNPVGMTSANAPVLTKDSVVVEEEVTTDPSNPGKKTDEPPLIDPPRSNINILEMQRMMSQLSIDDALQQMSSNNFTMDSMQKANKSLADKQIEQMEKQAQKQEQSDKKSGVFSWVSKIFTAITVVVSVALIATGVGAGFGIGLLVGLAAGQILQLDAVKNALTKMLSAVFGEQIGAILANVVIIGIQIAIAIKSGNIGQALLKGSNILKGIANVVPKIIKSVMNADKLMKANTLTQATGGIVQGGMAVDLGITNIQLANAKKVVQDNTADMSFIQSQIEQALTVQKQATSRLSASLNETTATVSSYGSLNRSWS